MTHEDKGHFRKKHSPDRKLNPDIAEILKNRVSDNAISCAVAHQTAADLEVLPSEVGFHMDFLEMRISKCQLGLFGYAPQKKIVKPAETLLPEMEKAIRESLVNDRLSCKSAWEIAKRLGKKRMEIASACEALTLKITPCQLGAF